MNGWSKEDLEEECGDDITDQLAFLSGCFKHKLSNDVVIPDGWIIPDELLRKFAELIVRECAAKAWWAEQYNMGDGVPISKQIEQHFGIEPNIVYKMECFNCPMCGLQNPTTSCGLPNCGLIYGVKE